MEVIPAIDLRGGRCVRLYQGAFEKEEVFSEDPVGTALRWEELGALRLHVVDLDGASAGQPVHLEAIRNIASRVHIPLQVGGGIRTREAASRLLGLGVERVVLGTVAVQDPGLLGRMLAALGPERLVVSVDARGGKVALWGWKEQSQVAALELVQALARLGIRRVVYTDILRDGTLAGPNMAALQELVAHGGLPVIASGGIASVDHLVALAHLGVEGAIVGRALYAGVVDLQAALQAVAAASRS
ncbi:MAG: 1-(5-phosphoribosyl)-5-[(5-phosphoribosylamino)methylideneamino]imidazole-4-carboxamide isomerase [Chloroflexi bacterium]|nr:1-(5-phosphoribosyl)-5-[(5-phosphoribosylamino)methylideneamino]imidazole-4-carboxamide isomerase [Chloroflexota bacterium]